MTAGSSPAPILDPEPAMLALKLIVASTRDGRAADHVLPWLRRRLDADDRFDVEVLDLRDWPLPMFGETYATIGDFHDPTYSSPLVRQWNAAIAGGDVYVVLTPEYNHSVPAVLKNAIDSVFVSFGFRNKAMAVVGYSGGQTGGARAVEHLAAIALEAELVPLRNSVLIPYVTRAFDDHEAVGPGTDTALQIALDDLAWWGELLRDGRAAGALPHAQMRLVAASTSA
jgi:NAD(P)H-dependent FMN reductase